MVVHAYSPNTQEAGGKGSRKIATFPGMATHHFPRSGRAWGKTGGKKEPSGGRDGLSAWLTASLGGG